MRKIFLLISCIFSLYINVSAQTVSGSIKGILMDADAKQPLAGATVSVSFTKDSTIASYTLSDKKGMFEIKNL